MVPVLRYYLVLFYILYTFKYIVYRQGTLGTLKVWYTKYSKARGVYNIIHLQN